MALAHLLGRPVQVMLDNLPASIDQYPGRPPSRARRARPRPGSNVLPDVPPIAEFVPGYETSAFAGLSAPAGTPREIVDKLNTAVGVTLAKPVLKAKILDMGGVPHADDTRRVRQLPRGGNRDGARRSAPPT